jgi:hypothetical protein
MSNLPLQHVPSTFIPQDLLSFYLVGAVTADTPKMNVGQMVKCTWMDMKWNNI